MQQNIKGSNLDNLNNTCNLSIAIYVFLYIFRNINQSWVTQSSPKPTLQVKQTVTLVKSFSYIEAISAYGDRIEKKVIDEATKLASRFFYGNVEKIFIILKD